MVAVFMLFVDTTAAFTSTKELRLYGNQSQSKDAGGLCHRVIRRDVRALTTEVQDLALLCHSYHTANRGMDTYVLRNTIEND